MSEPYQTLFTRIINRELPADFIYEDEYCVVINDIAPQANVHLLVIPRKPVKRLVDAKRSDTKLLGHLLWVAGEMARRSGVGDAFRVVINNGADAGQTVFHLHLHLLASEKFNESDIAAP
ncbi:MAG: histidine triad nucleotide-binding protein [Porticoccaceae bacterium]|nr:histidine triad nucleotide-binding protein [Porticoccaceae bacterium]|tara:strand:- start:198 stop:557 length:360 start_codon:yes stop_codon:yes gene_type:complete